MFSSAIWAIIGMAVVTYIPRMLPLVAIKADGVPPFLQGVLKNVPYAVLGALIFPAIFIINSGSLLHITLNDFLFGLIGGAVAFITSYLEWNIIFVVLSAIAVLTVYSLIV
ncbi:MAG: AzlD domain-containing protein [Tuberibacillus sp.]